MGRMGPEDASKIIILDYHANTADVVGFTEAERCAEWSNNADHRHGGLSNVLFVDAHVKLHRDGDLEPCTEENGNYTTKWCPHRGCGEGDDCYDDDGGFPEFAAYKVRVRSGSTIQREIPLESGYKEPNDAQARVQMVSQTDTRYELKFEDGGDFDYDAKVILERLADGNIKVSFATLTGHSFNFTLLDPSGTEVPGMISMYQTIDPSASNVNITGTAGCAP